MSSGPFISRVSTPAPGSSAPAVSTEGANSGAPKPGCPKTFLQVLSEGQRSLSALPTLPANSVKKFVKQVDMTASPEMEKTHGVRGMAERALEAERRVDALVASVGHGRTFSAAELIALQATVFRYSQTVEVISRAADRVVGAIKQTLGTQV